MQRVAMRWLQGTRLLEKSPRHVNCFVCEFKQHQNTFVCKETYPEKSTLIKVTQCHEPPIWGEHTTVMISWSFSNGDDWWMVQWCRWAVF